MKFSKHELRTLVREEMMRKRAIRKVIKLDESQIRQLIEAELTEIGMGQAKIVGPLGKFVEKMKEAKAALGEVYQNIGSDNKKGADQAEALLRAVTRIISALDSMPELSKDPWHGVRTGTDRERAR